MQLTYNYPVFPEQTMPSGMLPNLKEAQAAWYFYTLAQQKLELYYRDQEFHVTNQTYKDLNFEPLKYSIGVLYGIDPNEIDKYWDAVKLEARIWGLPEPDARYMQVKRLLM